MKNGCILVHYSYNPDELKTGTFHAMLKQLGITHEA